MIRYFLIFLFIILILAECVGDVCFHRSIHKVDKNSKLYFYMGMVVSLIMGLLWYYILQQYDNLAIPNALYQCLSVLAVTLVSLFVLNEKLTTTKMVGIFVCIIGLSLIQM